MDELQYRHTMTQYSQKQISHAFDVNDEGLFREMERTRRLGGDPWWVIGEYK